MQKYILLIFWCVATSTLWAQPERVGQAGANELLFNNVPRSSGLNGLDIASSVGIEASQVNPAGVGSIGESDTELLFAHTLWLIGTDIRLNYFGIAQGLGPDNGTLGLAINVIDYGEFVRTTVALPDGTLGTFNVSTLTAGLTYAKPLTDRILVGLTARVFNQSTPEINATAVAFDAGVQYKAGKKDRAKFGIALRNIGPNAGFTGDGLSQRVLLQNRNDYTTTVNIPSERFELPAVLSIGGSLDFFLGGKNTLTTTAGFLSNAFYFNQGGLGLTYAYGEYVALRASFLYENGIFGETIGVDGRYNAYTGMAAGATFQVPFKTGRRNYQGEEIFSKFSLDLSYRTTNPFGGTLSFGARLKL